MLALRLARGARPLAAFRRLLVAAASAGVGFLLLAALAHASVAQLLWCAVPLAAAVHLAVAVARTETGARAPAFFGPATAPLIAALSTALTTLAGSGLALALFLHLRGAASRMLGAAPIPPAGALTLLVSVPLLASLATVVSLRPRTAPPDRPAPSDLPWGAALVATGLALGAYAGEFAHGRELRLTLPGGAGHALPAMLAGWAVIALGLVLAGPGVTQLCGRLLCVFRPGAMRLLAGRMLQEEARRVGRPLGALCAVLTGAFVAAALYEPAAGAGSADPLAALGAWLVACCTVATALTAALETKKSREASTAALLRLGAPPRLLRGAAALRTAALLLAFVPLAATVAEVASLPLR